MARYRISRKAIRDLDALWQFIAKDNERAANALMDRISAAFQALVGQPRMGRPRPEIEPGMRSFVVDGLTVFYRIANGGIRIVRVWDGRQNPKKFQV
jgi:toxin ParE1/3/4